MAGWWFWNDEKRSRVMELAATGMVAEDIGAALGTTEASILTYCGRHQIPLFKYSPERQAVYDQRLRDRNAKKDAKKVAANQAKKIAQRKAFMAGIGLSPDTNKTSPVYRNTLPKLPEMSKSELRSMLTEAVRNTAEARA